MLIQVLLRIFKLAFIIETIHAIYKQKEKSHSRLLFFDVQGITGAIQNRLNHNYIL
uniref:hypothetical protein n=1 Tax=Bacillus cereus TaxID=1396 RepID=UPI001CEFA37C|nr:hypothetical protein [Bacillus cereus]